MLYTSSILGYQKNFGIPIHTCTFHSRRVLALLEPLPLHLSIVTWAQSKEGKMISSPLLTSYSTSCGAFCHGKAWGSRTFLKVNEDSPHLIYSVSSHWSFAYSLSTPACSLLRANPTMTTFTTFLTISWWRRDFRVTWHSIGTLLVLVFQYKTLRLQATSLYVNPILHTSTVCGECQYIHTGNFS